MKIINRTEVSHATTSGNLGTSRTCAAVDMSGWEGLRVIVPVEDTYNSTAGTLTIRLAGNASSSTGTTAFVNYTTGSGYISVSSTATTVIDDMLIQLDVSGTFPDRWVRAVIDGSSTHLLGTVIYEKYGMRESVVPTTDADYTYAYASLVGPTTA